MANYNITLYQYLHSKDVTDFIKEFFKTEVVFSARPCIHVHDDSNDYLLDPHQETNLFAKMEYCFGHQYITPTRIQVD